MCKIVNPMLERGRFEDFDGQGLNGGFRIPGPPLSRISLNIIATDGTDPESLGWEHISVSLLMNRVPTWEEMVYVKDIFWHEEETVLQFHPKKSAAVNRHPGVLHLWRKIGIDHELPPDILV